MARGGVNKFAVKKARESLLAQGQNPSIDAVRVELGNTGSKSTIHRYLKEIEEEEGTRLDDQALLSETLKEMVAKLAAKLHEEAQAIVDDANTKHSSQIEACQQTIQQQQQQLEQTTEQQQALEQALSESNTAFETMQIQWQAEQVQNQALTQQLNMRHVEVREKQTQIQSLEEKHQHARDALVHYRESVKEQRDQEHRRFEQQIQQHQAEQRTLSQTLMVKQETLTQLNKTNVQLLTEQQETKKQLSIQQNNNQQYEISVMALREERVKLTSQIEAMTQRCAGFEQKINRFQAQKESDVVRYQDLQIALAKAQTESEIKEHIIAKLHIISLPDEKENEVLPENEEV